MPDDFDFTFNSLWQMSDTEVAGIEKSRAERDQIYIANGVVPEHVVAKELKERGTYASLTDEDIDEVEDLAAEAKEAEAELAANPTVKVAPAPGKSAV